MSDSQMIEQILEVVTKLSQDQKKLHEGLTKIAQRTEATENAVIQLKKENDVLNGELNELRQKEFKQTFLIFGIPYAKTGDNMTAVVKKIGLLLGVQLTEHDFSRRPYIVGHRNEKTGHIIGTFYSTQKRDEFSMKFKEKKRAAPLLLENIVIDLAPNHPLRGKPINLRWELTDYTKKLLAEAKKHTANFKYIWESDGRVLMKRDESSKPLNINNFAKLEQVLTTPMDQQ